MIAPYQRVRVTRQTALRIEKLENLLAYLRQAPGGRKTVEIRTFLNLSISGGRKYIKELLDAEVVDAVAAGSAKEKQCADNVRYAIVSETKAAEFMAAVAVPDSVRPPGKGALARPLPRGVHVLADDTHFAVRVNRNPVKRDPLVEALFGPARAVA
jgi:predicted transcriptional regulator